MEFEKIRELAALMRETGLTSLHYSESGSEIKMERAAAAIQQSPPAAAVLPELPLPAAAPEQIVNDGAHTVKSPMVGVFYSAPGADKKPYVALGDTVSPGDVLCIIEAMKIMNEITAEQGGVIVEICAGNKQVVEFGQPLFRIAGDNL